MIPSERFIQGAAGKEIFLRTWAEAENPVGVVQIFHGMAEHSARYAGFAKYLNARGWLVYANDQRGHGYTLRAGDIPGYLGPDGFSNIVEDAKKITDIIKAEQPGLPVYIFAHSFGSFIGQEYITRYSDFIDGIILSGSAKQDGADVKAGSMVASLQNTLLDNKKPAKLLDRLSFSSYGKHIKDKKTDLDWLSRDQEEVQRYITDELCGFIVPINFYYELFRGFKNLYLPSRLKEIRQDLPLLLVAGDEDPVGKRGESVKALYEQYQALGMTRVTIKLFPGGRHESINEINKEEVFVFVYQWLASSLEEGS